MPKPALFVYYLVAGITVGIWGVTFVSTKILLQYGLDPASIFFYRFLIAFVLMWCFFRKEPFWAHTWQDEIKTAALGLFGGSLYFLTENTALEYTLSTNVSFILCSAPLITALLIGLVSHSIKNTFRFWFVLGSSLSLLGIGMVIFSGHFLLRLSPKGDLLCLCAALCWGLYTVFLKDLEKRYSSLFITLKVFFYGLLTVIPCFFFLRPLYFSKVLIQPVVLGNLLFLGVVASMLCFLSWNTVIRHIGAIRATNFIYLSPLFTTLASAFFLREPITGMSLLGAVLIIAGVWAASSGFFYREKK